MKHIREGLRLDPDHAECAGLFRRMKRAGAALDRGRTASGKRDFQAACEAFTDALEAAKAPTHSPFTASVLAQRANARLRLRSTTRLWPDGAGGDRVAGGPQARVLHPGHRVAAPG